MGYAPKSYITNHTHPQVFALAEVD